MEGGSDRRGGIGSIGSCSGSRGTGSCGGGGCGSGIGGRRVGRDGEPAAVGASEAWEAALDDVLYSASPSTNLEADPAESDASDVFLYALAGCFPFHAWC